MMGKVRVLVNCITMDRGNFSPLVRKVNYWERRGVLVTILGSKHLYRNLKRNYPLLSDSVKFLCVVKGHREIDSRLELIKEGLRRNIALFKRRNEFSLGSFDVIYTISSVLDLVIFPAWLKGRHGKRIKWATVFDNTVSIKGPGSKITRFLAWLFFHISLKFLKKADVIFVISNELRDYLLKKGFSPERLVVTGNGVEGDLIVKAKRPRKYKFDAIFVGRIHEAKGIYDMLEVVRRVKRYYPNFKLAIVGRGDPTTEKRYKRRIEELDLKKNILFLGYKTGLEKFEIIKSSKIFLFLSHEESFGVALLEAVCCGLPAFVYELKSYSSIYRRGEVNMFKRGDYDSIAKAIISTVKKNIIYHPEFTYLLKRYSWDKIAQKELSFLHP